MGCRVFAEGCAKKKIKKVVKIAHYEITAREPVPQIRTGG
jgi:hypothetical protein